MGFMRRLRLSRSDAEVGAAADAMGLDAFGTETVAAEAPPEQAAGTAPQARVAIAVLSALVLIEAVPTALWVRNRLRPPAVAAPVAAAALPPAATLPLASCEPAVDPAAASTGAAARAATAGVGGKQTAAAAKTEAVIPPVAPPVERGTVAGSVAVTAPVAMQVLLRGRVVATTEAESFMLPVGTHDLEFVNSAVGFRARRTVNVQAGKTAALRLDVPNGTLHINAVPWAEVFMDGQRIGETPIGNLQTVVGTRELVFRHPDLPERRTTVLVTTKEPARVSMDLRKK